MFKLIALYSKAEDVVAFEKHYREVHAPLAMKMPGLKKCELNWVKGSPGGEARYHLIAELYFEDKAALKAAMSSPEGMAAAKDLMGFAGKIVHLVTAECETM
ncbi:MAG: EthD family reductase [Phycisphaerae bacterium]